MNALANADVGNYMNDRFISSFQKVGTFRIVNGEKQGGNVASYFCLSDGSVLHAIAGPVNAATLLREARWVIENRKMAVSASKGDIEKYRAFFRKAHLERLRQEYRGRAKPGPLPGDTDIAAATTETLAKMPLGKGRPLQAQVHTLLAAYPLVKLEQVYPVVFERILGEKVSTLPVLEN
ncbi:MAG TPA: hypothetical protein VGY66_21330 [Gemmataceae bacterium]|nr:hypothetical protein [Gemmataceae bacterium]